MNKVVILLFLLCSFASAQSPVGAFIGFSTLGTAEGEFTAEYVNEGFPKINTTGQWEPVRK